MWTVWLVKGLFFVCGLGWMRPSLLEHLFWGLTNCSSLVSSPFLDIRGNHWNMSACNCGNRGIRCTAWSWLFLNTKQADHGQFFQLTSNDCCISRGSDLTDMGGWGECYTGSSVFCWLQRQWCLMFLVITKSGGILIDRPKHLDAVVSICLHTMSTPSHPTRPSLKSTPLPTQPTRICPWTSARCGRLCVEVMVYGKDHWTPCNISERDLHCL